MSFVPPKPPVFSCEKLTAQALAELYATLALYPERISAQLDRHPDQYRSGGPVSACARGYASLLMLGSTQGPSNEQIYERAMDVAYRGGQPDMGRSVADGIIERRAEMFQQAGYVQALAASLDQPEGQIAALEGLELANLGKLLVAGLNLACGLEQSPMIREICETQMAAFRPIYWETSMLVMRDQIMLLAAMGGQ